MATKMAYLTDGDMIILATALRILPKGTLDMKKLATARGLANANSAGACYGGAKKKLFDAADELMAKGINTTEVLV